MFAPPIKPVHRDLVVDPTNETPTSFRLNAVFRGSEIGFIEVETRMHKGKVVGLIKDLEINTDGVETIYIGLDLLDIARDRIRKSFEEGSTVLVADLPAGTAARFGKILDAAGYHVSKNTEIPQRDFFATRESFEKVYGELQESRDTFGTLRMPKVTRTAGVTT
jgi:hypothetical protein